MENEIALPHVAEDFIKRSRKSSKSKGLNPANHNTDTKRYAKLSLSLTNAEKEKIEAYRNTHYSRMSISAMIMDILDKEGCFM